MKVKVQKLIQNLMNNTKNYLKTLSKKQITAISTLVIMITQMFSPYTVLLSTVKAAVNPTTDQLIVLRATKPTTSSSGKKIVEVTYAITAENIVSFDFNIGYDSTKIAPAARGTGAACTNTSIVPTNKKTACGYWHDANVYLPAYTYTVNYTTSTIRLAGQSSSGSAINLLDEEYDKATLGDEAYGYDYYLPIITLYFYLVDESITEITQDMLYWKPVSGSTAMPTGFKYIYNNGTTNQTCLTTDSVGYEGFATAQKQVDSLELTASPTDVTYKNGEKLDLTGGTITIHYNDGTKDENVNIVDKIKDGTFTLDTEYASDSSKKATITCSGKKVEIPYYVLLGAELKTAPNNTTYEHGDVIDFTGGELNAIFTDSNGATVKEVISIPTGISNNTITTNTTTANVNKNPVTLTYEGYNVDINLNVDDPIDHIAVTTPPTKVIYDQDETISFAGGKITAYKKSGATTVIPSTDTSITLNTTKADINTVSESKKWITTTGTEAGTQSVTVTYQGKTATYDITVNDVIDSIEVTKQPTAENKYGATNLDFSGLQVKVETRGGGTFYIDQNSVNIDTSTYNPNSLDIQEFTVTYGGKTSTTKAQITLIDYVTDITTNFVTTTFDYDTPLSTVITGATYVKNYASGSTSSAEPITASMVNGYNQKPAPTLFDSNHEYSYSIRITLSTGSNKFDEVPITKNQTIKIQDTISKIDIDNYPDTIAFEYGDEFEYTNGRIKTVYTSGATGEVIHMSDSNVKLTQTDGTTAITTSVAKAKFNNGQAKETVLVTYTKNGKSYTTNYQITISDKITGIAITKEPTKTFEYGDSFTTGSGEITVSYAVADPETVSMSDAKVLITQIDDTEINMTPTGYDANNKYTEHLKVEYMDTTTTYDIEISNTIDKIEIDESPKTTYEYQENIANVGGTIKVIRKDGSNTIIPITDDMISGLNTNTPGTRTATVTYINEAVTKTTTYTYTVANSLIGATINPPTKTTYNHNERVEDGTVTLKYADGSTAQGSWNDVAITEADGSTLNMAPTLGEYEASATKHKISKTIKFSYTKDGITATDVTLPIEIINNVKSISMLTTPKTEYSVKDLLDVTGGEILVTRAVGSEAKTITSDMVSGFDSTAEHTDLTLTVKYTENGITKQTDYNVNVKDEVSAVVLKTAPKTEYKYGESFDITGGVITVTRPSGNIDIPLTEDMITTTFNPQQLGEQVINISYGGFNITYTVNVKDYMTGIVLTPPTKNKYEYGEPLDLTGGSVQKVMASGATTTPVELSDTTQVTLSVFNSTQEGAQTIYVTYEGETKSFAVTVEDNVISIAMANTPKQSYLYGESLNVSGGTILVTRTSGRTETINIENSMVAGFNPNQLGAQTLTITYKEKTTSYEVVVEDYAKDIEITKPNKQIYNLGETIDLTGATVKLVMASGTATTPVAITESMITGFDSTTEGAKIITVAYGGFTKTFGISVIDNIQGIVLVTLPNKLDYLYGEPLDLTGGAISLVKSSGTSTPIAITSNMITGYNPNKLGDQIITITHEGFTQQFVVNVKDYISKLQIKAPDKTKYEYGEELDLIGGTVAIIMASGKVEEKTEMTASMTSTFDNKKVGSQNIQVEYKGLKGNFTVTVEDKVKGISMKDLPSKIEYEYGEDLDVTGATICVVKSSGIYTVKVTKDMVSGFNPKNSGAQVITVTYDGFTTQFVVSVKAQPQKPEKPENPETPEKPETPVKPENPTKPSKPNQTGTTNNNETKPAEKPSTPVEEPTNPVENTTVEEPTNNTQKPTATLGEKEENKELNEKLIAGVIGGLGILLLIILMIIRRNNVKIYIEEDGEFKLGGFDKLTKDNLTINVDRCLDGETYKNRVKICLKDYISEKLDGKELQIRHRGEIVKYTIKYADKPIEINLE